MATVTGYTAARMKEIEDASVVDGDIIGGHLILKRHDGTEIDAGIASGPEGPTGPSITLPMVHTWTVSGPIYVPNGAFGYIPPMAVSVPEGTSVKLRAIRYGIRAGTSAVFSFQQNGVAVTSLTACVAGVTRLTTQANGGAPVDLADLDELAPVVSAVTGNPDGLFISMFMDVHR